MAALKAAGGNPYARFSADPRIRVFDRIAWIYGFLFHAQRLAFRRSLRTFQHRLDLPGKARILDIGCGTGAYVSVLTEMGHEVRAVDASPRMVATAKRLLLHAGFADHAVQVSVGDPLEGLERSDYRRFRRSGVRELRDFFAEVEVIIASPGSAWYLCRT
jgi:SAM-dependent methyltransferase